jgi:hypothetical protein
MRRMLTAASLITLLCAAPAGASALKSVWGPLQLPNGKSAGPTYRALGVDNLQTALLWRDVAATRPAHPRDPADPAYVWDPRIDEAVALGKRYGFDVALMVKDTPPWANGGKDVTWAPTRARDYADFLYAASRRYPRVRRWMIWGEPSREANFHPLPHNSPQAPRRYARMLDAAYGALKSASRRNIVIGGMTFTAGDVVPRDWVKWMRLPNGKPPRLDMYGHNPFSVRIPDLSQKPYSDGNYDFSDLDTLHRQLWRNYRAAYPRWRKRGPAIWISEWTIQADHGSADFNFFVSHEGQGEWIAAAFREANKHPYIADIGWLGLLDEPLAPYNRTTGLLTYELKRKPSWYAFKRAP